MIYNDLSNKKKKIQNLGSFYCLNCKKKFSTNFLKFKNRDENWVILFSYLKREFIAKS